MGDSNNTSNGTCNVTGNLINVMRGIKPYNGENLTTSVIGIRRQASYSAYNTRAYFPYWKDRSGRTINRRCGYGRGGHGTYLSCTAVHTRVPGHYWRDTSTTADCFRPRQRRSICDSVLNDRQGRGSPGGNACIRRARRPWRRAECDQGTGG